MNTKREMKEEKKKYIAVSKDYFNKLNFKINWDWDSYFRLQRLEILEGIKILTPQ